MKLPGRKKTLTTQAYSVQGLAMEAVAMNQFLITIYGQDHLYLPYNMKKTAPKTVAKAIITQNKLIMETFVIVLVGISRDMMPSLQLTLYQEIKGILGVSDTHKTDQTGRWFVLVKEKVFLPTQKNVMAKLDKWIRT